MKIALGEIHASPHLSHNNTELCSAKEVIFWCLVSATEPKIRSMKKTELVIEEEKINKVTESLNMETNYICK